MFMASFQEEVVMDQENISENRIEPKTANPESPSSSKELSSPILDNCKPHTDQTNADSILNTPEVYVSKPDTNRIAEPDVNLTKPNGNIEPDVDLTKPVTNTGPNLKKQDTHLTKVNISLSAPSAALSESNAIVSESDSSLSQPDLISRVEQNPIPFEPDNDLTKPDSELSQINGDPVKRDNDLFAQDAPLSKPDISKLDISSSKPDVILSKPDVILSNQDVILSKPDTNISNPDVILSKPYACLDKPDVILSKPDANLDTPDVIQSKQDSNLENPDLTGVKTEVNNQTNANVSPTKPDVILAKPDVIQNKPNLSLKKQLASIPDESQSVSCKSDILKPIDTRVSGTAPTSNASNPTRKKPSQLKPLSLSTPRTNPNQNKQRNIPSIRPQQLRTKISKKTPSEGDEVKDKTELFKSPIPNFDEFIQRFTGKLNISKGTSKEVHFSETDIELCHKIGEGVSGVVYVVKHKASGFKMAAKRMKWNPQLEEQKRILMDLEIMSIQNSPYIVDYFGSLICSDFAWIYMELMDTCLDRLIKSYGPLPEIIVGKVVVSTLHALDYLKSVHDIIHRDVKPSNILINKHGDIKMCDFGISKQLVESRAETRGAGPTAYISPERLDIELKEYDVRADVWSLGISVIELLTGNLPYAHCGSDFEVMSKILKDPAPRLPDKLSVSSECRHFIELCLRKDFRTRPKFRDLLESSEFVKIYEKKEVDISGWYVTLTEKK